MFSKPKSLIVLALAGLFSLALSGATAHAVPITGEIDFGLGSVVMNGTAATATAFTSFSPGLVAVTHTGAFSIISTGTAATTSQGAGFSFSPFSGPLTNVWTVTNGSTTFTFELDGITTITRQTALDPNTLTLNGFGKISATGAGGFTTTNGLWSLTATGDTMNVSFSSATVGLPDGGFTLALLGSAVIGLELLRRKLQVA